MIHSVGRVDGIFKCHTGRDRNRCRQVSVHVREVAGGRACVQGRRASMNECMAGRRGPS